MNIYFFSFNNKALQMTVIIIIINVYSNVCSGVEFFFSHYRIFSIMMLTKFYRDTKFLNQFKSTVH